MKNTSDTRENRASAIADKMKREARQARAVGSPPAGLDLSKPRGRRLAIAAAKENPEPAIAAAKKNPEPARVPDGSGSEKYGNPGTTDWTGEGRPDHEPR